MAALGNVIWFVFGGEFLALFWLAAAVFFAVTIIGLPIARACLEFAKLSAFPFGKEVIRETELKGVHNVSGIARFIYIILNIIWLPVGLFLTVVYFALGIILFITIIGIPAGIVFVRMGQFLLFPIGARVVSKKQAQASATANELEKRGLVVVGNGISALQQNVTVNVGQISTESISPERQILKTNQTHQIATNQISWKEKIMFCSQCGKEVSDNARFCGHCGAKTGEPDTAVQTAVNPPPLQYAPQQRQYSIAEGSGSNSSLLLHYTLMTGFADTNFKYFDANRQNITADKLFNRSKGAIIARDLLIGPLNSQGFAVKAEIYNDKICFKRLSMGGLGKPTADIFEINGGEIASIEMSNKFMDKSITIVMHSGASLNFSVPKKHLERITQIVNGMISGNPR